MISSAAAGNKLLYIDATTIPTSLALSVIELACGAPISFAAPEMIKASVLQASYADLFAKERERVMMGNGNRISESQPPV